MQNVMYAAKVSIFFERNALSADFFIFHSKREAIAHGRQASSRRVAIWVVFRGNSTPSDDKSPCLSAFPGCGARKSAPLQSLQPPPPYAPEAIASLYQAEYVRVFYLRRHGACVAAADAHPRSWRTMRHDKASTYTAGGRACRVARCRPPLRPLPVQRS